MAEGNGRPASVELVNAKISGLRWELRCWSLLLTLGVLSNHFSLPQTAAHTALAFFN